MATALAERNETMPVLRQDANSLIAAIERAASNPQMNIEAVERLFAMHQKILAQQAEAEFNAAMARAQAKITPVANNAANTQTNSRYAKLAAICEAIMPIVTAEGLSVSYGSADSPKEGYIRTVATVSHASGHTRQYHLDMPLDDVGAKGNANKTKVHATGSTISYSRRYLACMIFNVTTEDDDDGNKAGGVMPEQQRADFEVAIDSMADADKLAELWKKIVTVCQSTGDKESYEHFKKRVADHGKTLKGKK